MALTWGMDVETVVHAHDGKLTAIKRDEALMPEHHR